MTFTANIKHNCSTPESFPAFYISNTRRTGKNYIILVTERNGTDLTGIVITESDTHKIGELSSGWSASCFDRLNGSFTITQDR